MKLGGFSSVGIFVCFLLFAVGGTFGAEGESSNSSGAQDLAPHRGAPETNDALAADHELVRLSAQGGEGWFSGLFSWFGSSSNSNDSHGVGTLAHRVPRRSKEPTTRPHDTKSPDRNEQPVKAVASKRSARPLKPDVKSKLKADAGNTGARAAKAAPKTSAEHGQDRGEKVVAKASAKAEETHAAQSTPMASAEHGQDHGKKVVAKAPAKSDETHAAQSTPMASAEHGQDHGKKVVAKAPAKSDETHAAQSTPMASAEHGQDHGKKVVAKASAKTDETHAAQSTPMASAEHGQDHGKRVVAKASAKTDETQAAKSVPKTSPEHDKDHNTTSVAKAAAGPDETLTSNSVTNAAVDDDEAAGSKSVAEASADEDQEGSSEDHGKDANEKKDKSYDVAALPAYQSALCIEPVVIKETPDAKLEATVETDLGDAAADRGWLSTLTRLFGGGETADASSEGELENSGDGDEHAGVDGDHKDGSADDHVDEANADDGEEDGYGDDDDTEISILKPSEATPVWPDNPVVGCSQQPYMLVRQFTRIQDNIARGQAKARAQQRNFMRKLSSMFRRLPEEVWDDTRNARAAVYYVLGGGDARVLLRIAGRDLPAGLTQRLVRGVFAFGEGRQADSRALLLSLKAREQGPLLSGPLALIQAALVEEQNLDKALQLYDQARLFAAGTLVEEAALRKSMLLYAKLGNFDRFDQMSSQHYRRFRRSLFRPDVLRRIVTGFVGKTFKGDAAKWRTRLETELDRSSLVERASLYLWVAAETTRRGDIFNAKFAAEKAAALYPKGTHERNRAELYRGAALVATAEVEHGLKLLKAVRRARLGGPDRELYDAATGVGGQVLKPVSVERTVPTRPPDVVTRAEDVLSSVDELVGGIE